METEFGNRTTFSAKTYLRKVKKNLWGDFVKTLGVKKGGIFKKKTWDLHGSEFTMP